MNESAFPSGDQRGHEPEFNSYRTRQQARQQCVRWRETEDAEFRVVRYSAEDQ